MEILCIYRNLNKENTTFLNCLGEMAQDYGIIKNGETEIYVQRIMHEQISTSETNHRYYGPYERYIKRPLDVFYATGSMILLSPVMLFLFVFVWIK